MKAISSLGGSKLDHFRPLVSTFQRPCSALSSQPLLHSLELWVPWHCKKQHACPDKNVKISRKYTYSAKKRVRRCGTYSADAAKVRIRVHYYSVTSLSSFLPALHLKRRESRLHEVHRT